MVHELVRYMISVKTFHLMYKHFEEWMSLQPVLKTLSFEFSVQIHSWTDNDTKKCFTLYQGYISPCFQLLLSYSAMILTEYFIIIIIYFMLWYWLLNISLE